MPLGETIVSFILQTVDVFAAELYAGALIVVDERRCRVRLLPLTI